jgi:predicted enzyme related to lactoylglutathione lyase
MATRSKYTPGTFSWTDLTTPDQEAAKGFYGTLFGWEAEDQPVGEGVVYSLMKLDGQDVAAISPQPQQQRDAGAPPAWNSYITVESADAALARAEELGATIHAPAFDVFDVGRMGVVQDPLGAFFLAWEPKSHIGASLVNAPGALTWNELATPDLDGAEKFYGGLFGWTTEPLPESDAPYRVIKNADGHTNGGISAMAPPGTPPHWLVYFGAEQADATLSRVGELGGSTLMEPTDIGPAGRIAVARDPQGAVFAIYSGRFEE